MRTAYGPGQEAGAWREERLRGGKGWGGPGEVLPGLLELGRADAG